MPTIPCPEKIDCACQDTPFVNLSAEAPDLPTYLGAGFARPLPPGDVAWQAYACNQWCESTVSQEAADLCAQALALECATASWRVPGSGTSAPPVPPALSPIGRSRYTTARNEQQSGTSRCPDGLLFEFVVPAGVFVGLANGTGLTAFQTALASANAMAASYAQRQAALRRVCLSSLPSPVCVNAPLDVPIVATGRFVATSGQVNVWNNPVMPPGLTFEGGPQPGPDGNARITGTPTTPGLYVFIVTVRVPNGDTMTKVYSLTVSGVTSAPPAATKGQPYAEQLATIGFNGPVFSLASGTLPAGLTLQADGTITGTPTSVGTSAFTVEMFDGTRVCQQQLALTVTAAAFPWALVWPAPFVQEAPPDDFNSAFAAAGFAIHTEGQVPDGQVAVIILTPLTPTNGEMFYTGPNATGHIKLVVTNDASGTWTVTVTQDGATIYTADQTAFPGDQTIEADFPIAAGVASHLEVFTIQVSSASPALCITDVACNLS